MSLRFPTSSDTIQALKSQKMDKGLKFRILEVERLYYQCREDKGALSSCMVPGS